MKIWIEGYEIEYGSGNIKIYDSYKVTGLAEMACILIGFENQTGYKSKRSREDLIVEWRAHNKLYNWGLFRSHTKDVDLNDDEKWYRKIAYWILGRL